MTREPPSRDEGAGDLPDREAEAKTPRTHRCPICETEVSRDSGEFPFCSKRCRMVDLGAWLGGRYVVSRRITDEDLSR